MSTAVRMVSPAGGGQRLSMSPQEPAEDAPRCLRVSMLTSSFPRWVGDSAGHAILTLAQALSPSVAVSVVAPHAPGLATREVLAGVTVRRVPYFVPTSTQCVAYGRAGIPANLATHPLARLQLPFFVGAFGLGAWLGSASVDLIHAHWASSALVARVVAGVQRLPYVVTLRGSAARAMPASLLKCALEGAAAVICPHPEMTALARRHGAGKLFEIPNPVLSCRVAARSAGDPAVGRTGRLRWAAVYVGRLAAERDPGAFIRCLPHVLARVPESRFCVVGDGPLRSQLEGLAAKLGCRAAVEFTGFRSDVATFLSQAQVFVICNRDENLWSQALVEALHSGVPTVATDVGWTRRVLAPAEAALIVPLGAPEQMAKAIVTLLTDEPLRQRMSRQALRLAASRGDSPRAVAEATRAVYEQVVADWNSERAQPFRSSSPKRQS